MSVPKTDGFVSDVRVGPALVTWLPEELVLSSETREVPIDPLGNVGDTRSATVVELVAPWVLDHGLSVPPKEAESEQARAFEQRFSDSRRVVVSVVTNYSAEEFESLSSRDSLAGDRIELPTATNERAFAETLPTADGARWVSVKAQRENHLVEVNGINMDVADVYRVSQGVVLEGPGP